jgi:iron complex outermembrane receptor protein
MPIAAMKRLYAILLTSLLLTPLTAQEASTDSTKRLKLPSQQLFSAGMIHHPLQLIQGRIPGLLITRPGADPNHRFESRLMGMHTMGATSAEPLLLVDGFPQVSGYTIDPADVHSIDVLDPAQAATYGLRVGAGVLHIQTRRLLDTGWTVRYSAAAALETLANKPPMLNSNEFRLRYDTPGAVAFRPDANLGGDTDWVRAVTRTGFGQWHQAILGYRTAKTQYRLALHARSMEGIIRRTGYDQLNAHFHADHRWLNDRLHLQGNLLHTNRKANYVVPDVMRLATVLNPTLPIRSDTANTTGGYAQLPYFGIANPVSIIEQMTNQGESDITTIQTQARVNLSAQLLLTGQLGLQQAHDQRTLIAPPTEYYLGLSNNGFALRQTDNTNNRFARVELQYQPAPFIKLRSAHQWQRTYARQYSFTGTELTNIYQAVTENTDQEAHTTASFWLAADVHHKWLSAIAMLRREGSSTLGQQEKWTWLPLFQLALDLEGLTGIATSIRSSFSLTGNAPQHSYLSQTVYRPNIPFYYADQYSPSMVPIHYSNPNLRRELRQAWQTELNLSAGGISFQLMYFNSQSSDLIRRVIRRQTIAGVATNDLYTYANVAEIRNTGWQASMRATLLERNDFSWSAAFNLWLQHARFGQLSQSPYEPDAFTRYGFLGFSANAYLFDLLEGTALGTIYAPANQGISAQGHWQYRDDNNDGIPDRVVAGNALPSMGMGWHNTLRWRQWDIQLFCRGLFGHARVDPIQLSTSSLFTRPGYNVNQHYIAPLREFAFYSDYFVLPASYLRLDNLVLGYTISPGAKHKFAGWRCYAAAQHLLTLSRFRFSDPEPLLAFPEGETTTPLSAGPYFQASTISLGIEARF